MSAGSARFAAAQRGFTFGGIADPPAGGRYKLRGEVIDYLPANAADQQALEPVYEEMDGWSESTAGARRWADLPAQAIKYIRRIEELIECPVASVSTSPERDDTILVRDPFAD